MEGNVIVTLAENGNAFGWAIGQNAERVWTLRPKTGFKFTERGLERAERSSGINRQGSWRQIRPLQVHLSKHGSLDSLLIELDCGLPD